MYCRFFPILFSQNRKLDLLLHMIPQGRVWLLFFPAPKIQRKSPHVSGDRYPSNSLEATLSQGQWLRSQPSEAPVPAISGRHLCHLCHLCHVMLCHLCQMPTGPQCLVKLPLALCLCAEKAITKSLQSRRRLGTFASENPSSGHYRPPSLLSYTCLCVWS